MVIPESFKTLQDFNPYTTYLPEYLARRYKTEEEILEWIRPVREALRTNLFLLLAWAMGRTDMRHPWLLERCNEVQRSPNGYLDLWAREHYKSTIITVGLSIQDILRTHGISAVGTEAGIGIFSHTRPIAKGFLRQIKTELETNVLLRHLFADIIYHEPRKQSPKWSEDDGLLVKRSSNRNEATVEAWGLVDGQPTGKHYTIRVYDDVVTEKSVSTADQIEKTTRAWEMSDNLGAFGGVSRMIGTTYAFADTYSEVRKRGAARARVYPGTSDGTEEGVPVFRSKEWISEKRKIQGPYVFSSQILINPVPEGMQTFKREWIQKYDTNPATSNRYILVDPANSKKAKTADYTVMFVLGLAADGNWYLIDAIRDRLSLTERADRLFDLHRTHEPLGVFYQEYGIEADRQHMEDRQDRETYRFNITPVSSRVRKEDRIRRLVPMFEQSKIYLPKTLHRTDFQGVTRDLVTDFIEEEYAPFPLTLGHDDMLDALSMIAEPKLTFVVPKKPAAQSVQRVIKVQPQGTRGWLS